jgi:DNA-binding transcriptional LysR family regulator
MRCCCSKPVTAFAIRCWAPVRRSVVRKPISVFGHSIGTIRCMVASGLGISVLPDGALQHPYSSEMISVIPFTPPAPSRRVALAWRNCFVRPKAIDALVVCGARIELAGLPLADLSSDQDFCL